MPHNTQHSADSETPAEPSDAGDVAPRVLLFFDYA
jgi:hypothetical protein